ncbi:MAG TPA: TetR/AcrR family transcriptional regulator [Desulfuromonadaceae bacterium]
MSYGRPLEYDPDKALDAAMQVFWLHGYEATSLQDLLTAMGLSKSSLYQGFGGKKELFLRCVNRYCDGLSDRLGRLLEGAESGLAFIEEVLLNAAAEAKRTDFRRGCLLMNTATEFAQKDPEIAARVTTGFEGLRGLLKTAILRGQEEGDITREQDAEALASFLISSLGGIKTVVKGGGDEKRVRDIVNIVVRALR